MQYGKDWSPGKNTAGTFARMILEAARLFPKNGASLLNSYQ
jgi:hypothetical protein